MNALAMDLGGSSGKIFLGCYNGQTIELKEILRFHNGPVEDAGHLYWDIHGIYNNLLTGILKASIKGFTSIGVDSYCNDYGLLGRNGELLSRIYMYRDHRTEGVQSIIDQRIPPFELYARTGCQQARFNTLVQLAAQMESPDRTIVNSAHTLLFIPDLINYYLCGEKVAEFTIASVSQLFNRIENKWDDRIFHAFNIPSDIFPQVIPSSTYLGSAKREILAKTGAKKFSVCTVGHHDTASAVAAVPSLEKNYAYISSGTWCLMGIVTDKMITSKAAFKNNFANEGGVGGKNRFLKNIMGLWLIQECQRQFREQGINTTFEGMDIEADEVVPFRSIINPDDPIFFQPGNMIRKIQDKCRETNQSIPETPAEINRCIKESLALAYRKTLMQIEAIAEVKIPFIHIIGGGAKSDLLNQFAASAMGIPVLAGPYEAAATGNLCAQFISSGEMSGWDEARTIVRNSFNLKEYQPDRKNEWDDAYSRFLNIIGE